MAYFSVQYCTLCAVLMENCAVLKFEMFCLQSTKANGIRTLFEATGKIMQCFMVLCFMMYQEDILHHTSLYLMWSTQRECLKVQVTLLR